MKQPTLVREYRELHEQAESKHLAEEITYSTQGKVLRKKVFAPNGECVLEDTYEYDSSDRLLTHNSYDTGELVECMKYDYPSEFERAYSCVIQHSWGGESHEISTFEAENRIQKIERRDEDGELVLQNETIFYESFSIEKEITRIFEDGNEMITEKEYSEDNELELYKITRNGNVEYYIQLEDEVDENEVVLKTVVRDLIKNSVDQEFWKEYDAAGNETVIESIDHGTGQELIETRSYDDQKRLTEKRVVDQSDTIVEFLSTEFDQEGQPSIVKQYTHMKPIIISTFEYEYE